MFQSIITLFNYSEEEDKYYQTIINNAEFQPIYKTEPDVIGTDNRSSCLIIIPYSIKDSSIYVNNDECKKYYLKPKEWEKSGNKENYFTLHNDIDFVVKGAKSDLTDVNLNEIKNTHDDVFVINQIKDFVDTLLSHFELTVN